MKWLAITERSLIRGMNSPCAPSVSRTHVGTHREAVASQTKGLHVEVNAVLTMPPNRAQIRKGSRQAKWINDLWQSLPVTPPSAPAAASAQGKIAGNRIGPHARLRIPSTPPPHLCVFLRNRHKLLTRREVRARMQTL